MPKENDGTGQEVRYDPYSTQQGAYYRCYDTCFVSRDGEGVDMWKHVPNCACGIVGDETISLDVRVRRGLVLLPRLPRAVITELNSAWGRFG